MIAVLAAGLSGQLAFRRSFRRINEARRKVRRIVAERNILVQEIRKAAHQTLRLKQDLRLARPRYAQLEQECANLERELEARKAAALSHTTERGKRKVQVHGATTAPAGIHVVQARETIGGIAKRYGVSVEQLTRWNDLEQGRRIAPGERLRVSALATRHEEPEQGGFR